MDYYGYGAYNPYYGYDGWMGGSYAYGDPDPDGWFFRRRIPFFPFFFPFFPFFSPFFFPFFW